MRTKVQMWGNSLAVRIPKPFAEEAGFQPNAEVEVRVIEGGLKLEPVQPPKWSLEDLVAGITPENRHSEVDFGPAVGREEW